MTRNALLFVASLALAGSVAACTASEPSQPTYSKDVFPIFAAHCVRCHGAGGALNQDLSAVLPNAPPNGYLNLYDNVGDCSLVSTSAGMSFKNLCTMGQPLTDLSCCHRGAHYYTMNGDALNGAAQIKSYLDATTGISMPPAPAPRLTSWEHDVVFAWLANPQP